MRDLVTIQLEAIRLGGVAKTADRQYARALARATGGEVRVEWNGRENEYVVALDHQSAEAEPETPDESPVSCHGCDWVGPVKWAVEHSTPVGGAPYFMCRRCDRLLTEYLAGRPIDWLQHGQIDPSDLRLVPENERIG